MIADAASPRGLSGPNLSAVVADLRLLAVRALKRMYRPAEKLFAFRLRREEGRDILEGISRRYTAIVLIALADEPPEVASEILAGSTSQEVCGRLLEEVDQSGDLGEAALTLWAARALEHPEGAKALHHVQGMAPAVGPYPTVEVSWSLSALTVPRGAATDEALADAVARRLVGSFEARSALFPHWPRGVRPSRFRSHVSCFADLVYPIQALSYYHQARGSSEALDAALRCAQQTRSLQGPQGQWWWHYDSRTGRIIERFPVYAVHQDAMGPMAFLALRDASGKDCREPIARGLQWLVCPPEITGSLIDPEADIIWRKVARFEPGKLARGLQAMASGLHPRLRVPGFNLLFRPGCVDYESRPYHMAWLLHAWGGNRISHLATL